MRSHYCQLIILVLRCSFLNYYVPTSQCNYEYIIILHYKLLNMASFLEPTRQHQTPQVLYPLMQRIWIYHTIIHRPYLRKNSK